MCSPHQKEEKIQACFTVILQDFFVEKRPYVEIAFFLIFP